MIRFLRIWIFSSFSSCFKSLETTTLEEQERILNVGACLECHDSEGEVMKESLVRGLQPLLERLHKSCVLPHFESAKDDLR
jgi:hypothetical protein